MGLLGKIGSVFGDLMGSGDIKAGAAAGREEALRYSTQARADLAPFKDFGQGQIAGLQNLMADPSGVTKLPSYQFKLSEGLGAIERSKLAKGKFFSGETARDIVDYAEGLASTTYDNEFMKRFNLVNLGQSAAAGQANVSTNLAGLAQQSWQTQGQDVASANAAGVNMLGSLGMFAYGGSQGWFKPSAKV